MIKNPVKMVVVRCLILCSKFAKKCLSAGLWRALPTHKRSPRPSSWIIGKGGKREMVGQEGREGNGQERAGEEGGKEGKGDRRGIPLRMKILATALAVVELSPKWLVQGHVRSNMHFIFACLLKSRCCSLRQIKFILSTAAAAALL